MVEKNITRNSLCNTIDHGEPNQILTLDTIVDPDQVDFTCLDGMIEGEMPWIPYPRRLETEGDFTNRCLHQLDELLRMLHLIHWKKALRLDQYQLQLGKRQCLGLDSVTIVRTFYSWSCANHYAMSIYFVFTGEIDIASLTWVRLYPEFTLRGDIEFIPISMRTSDGIAIESALRLTSEGVSKESVEIVTNPITMTITKHPIEFPITDKLDEEFTVYQVATRDNCSTKKRRHGKSCLRRSC
jgi:hypothetical protein